MPARRVRIAEVGERPRDLVKHRERVTSPGVARGLYRGAIRRPEGKRWTRERAVVAKPHARRNTREGCSAAEGVPGRESCASSRTGGGSGLGSVHEGPLPTRSGAPALPCGSRNLEWGERRGHPEVDSRLEGRRECLLRRAAIHSGGFRCRETPGSPGTVRVAQAARGRRREIDETRVLVAVLGSRDWQAASPYVVQGKSQGDLRMRGLARYQPSGAVDAASWG